MRLTPRAGRDAIEGWREGALRVRVGAPAQDGRANAAMLRLLAHALRVPAGAVHIVSGATSRMKLVEIAGVAQDEVLQRLEAPEDIDRALR